jgi:hypothetical protein
LALSAAALGLILALVSVIYFRQHSMIYHPRPYDATYARALPSNGVEINYSLPVGKRTAYYIPGREPLPKRLWIAFCGNGSLALDWTTILAGYPNNGDAFLLVDYPGYGKNAGYATIDSTRAGAEAALHALAERLHVRKEQLALCTIGHSLGAAVALDFAARHRVQRIPAIAPLRRCVKKRQPSSAICYPGCCSRTTTIEKLSPKSRSEIPAPKLRSFTA